MKAVILLVALAAKNLNPAINILVNFFGYIRFFNSLRFLLVLVGKEINLERILVS